MPSDGSMSGVDQVRRRTPEELERELAEAREQQAATAEILAAISSSPTDPRGAFEKIAASAAHLCDAYDAGILKVEGDLLRQVAHHGPIAMPDTLPLTREVSPGRAVLDRETIHVADLQAEADEFPDGSVRARHLGFRTILNVPLIRAGHAMGVMSIRRTDVRPFTDRQVDLLKIFADQAVIAIENTRLFEAEQASKRELSDALEQQTATGEILNVISRSPTTVEPVFAAIVESSVRLCGANYGAVARLEGDARHLVADYGMTPRWNETVNRIFPQELTRGLIGDAAMLDRTIIHVDNIQNDDSHEVSQALARTMGYHTALAVPMLRESRPVGAIIVFRQEERRFSDAEIGLLRTFADQAVIAIENTRLFEAEQASKRELQESLEYQTAISDVLNVISRSPNELQPVLDVIVKTAVRLCRSSYGHVRLLRDDGAYHIASHQILDPELLALMLENPFRPGVDSVSGRAALQGVPVHVVDVAADPLVSGFQRKISNKVRTALVVPLKRNGAVVGLISVFHGEVRPFTQQQIDLVATFANQAIIAMNNVRLFEEVQARNTELRMALEQQTATSELLKVIGRSTFDIQPIFETLAENAVRLCEAERSFIFRFDGQFLRVVATHNTTPELRAFVERNPVAPGRSGAAARAALERRTVHVLDAQADPEYTYGSRQLDPFRTIITVPILRGNELLGAILIYRHEVRAFTKSQIALLETFADQAGIAIENARLFEEVQARNRDLTALGEVGRAVSSTLDLKVVLKTIVERALELSDTHGGSIFYFHEDTGRFELGETMGLDEDVISRFRKLDIAAGQTGLSEAIATGKPLQIADITKRPSNALRDAAFEAGLRAALIVPLLSSEAPLGALVLQRRKPGEFPEAVVSLMQSFADQSAIALENARLFNEIAHKSRELEIASQHKSQFVANMSHELRTPLAAILGYAELIQEGFYGPLPDKALASLTRIRSNGKHLLGLINTVLDIAKIESGQFTLNMAEYDIESVIETVRSATESLAQNKKLSLKTQVAKALPVGLGDEQRLTQVLLNLVGNAIKFTDTGEVRVTAKAIDSDFNVSVTDTGPGIPEEHQARIFEQFHQVDSSNTKAKGGTGLGLAIARQIVEMHGGRIWVESTPGKGSTFQMELPTRAEFRRPGS